MAWTEEQQRAIDARGSDMLVAAAAGSGKTAVLVERIYSLVAGGADIERMLIVTFTNAVASEMRERLAARFGEQEDDAHMREQAQACRQAHIQTLHSFCRDVCRAYFQAADVDPGFRIIDQQEAQLMAGRALDDALIRAFDEPDEGLELLNTLRGPDALRDMVLELHDFLGSRADAEEWLASLAGEGMRARQRDELRAYIAARMAHVRGMLEGLAALAEAEPEAAIYHKSLERDLEQWPDGRDIGALLGFAPARFDAARGTPRGASSAPLAQLVKLMRKRAKDMTAAMQKLALLLAEGDAAGDAYLGGAIPALARLERLFEREYAGRKRERSALDFNDLEHHALRALGDAAVARSVRAMFDYVFVDEYQDISLVQESILNLVSPPRARFMVGDVKQSIYRFRQADPSIFMAKYDGFARGEGADTLRIDLNRNFRSRANVLNFVNGVFSRVMNREEYEIDYDDSAALRPGLPALEDDPAVELHILGDEEAEAGEGEDAEEEDELEQLSREESEARVAAQLIKELIGTPMLDRKTGQLRSVQARDIVVLSRAVKSLAPKALEVLLGEGIPAYADAAGGYFDTLEVRQLLELMRVIDNRLRDFDLLGVMHSPMFGFDAADLGAVRAASPKGSFTEALESYAQGGEGTEAALCARVRDFLSCLDAWQRDARSLPLSELAWLLLDETGYYVYVGALPGGLERQANLRLLSERAAQYEDAQHGGLHGFLQYVEQLRRAGQDMTTAATLGEGDDVVRIMSVHKSKGLEFPIVIGLNLGAAFRKGGRSDLLLNGEVGMGMYRMDGERTARHNTIARQAVAVRQEREQLAEELRVLYVMLTRARDRLLLVGSARRLWAQRLMWEYDMNPQPASMLDWVMPAAFAMMHTGEASVRYVRHPARGQAAARAETSLEEGLAALRAESPDEDTLRRMTWRYPYQTAVLAPLKLTASRLGRELEGPAARPECRERPQFMSEQAMNALERGVATHTVMQWLELERLRAADTGLAGELSAQLDALMRRGTLTPAQRRGVRAGDIARYFESEIGRRMLASPRVEREWPFVMRLSAAEALASGEGATDERMLVQGVIDCCFEEEGAWVLVDYKTDRDDDPEALRDRYCAQLRLYARALRDITQMPVRQAGLFLLRTGAFLDLSAETLV